MDRLITDLVDRFDRGILSRRQLMKILSEDKPNRIARMGVTKVIVSLHEKNPVGIVDHFAIAIDDFDSGQVTAELAKLGLKPENHPDAGFCVRDPDGVPVQIVRT